MSMATGESGQPAAGDRPPSVFSGTEPEDPNMAAATLTVMTPSEVATSYDPQQGDDILSPNTSFITSMDLGPEPERVPATMVEGTEQQTLYATARQPVHSFVEGYTAYLLVLFLTMLMLNLLTVLYLDTFGRGKKVKVTPKDILLPIVDPESILWQPLVCIHRCSPHRQQAGLYFPADGLCDLLYQALPPNLALAEAEASPCGEHLRGVASAAAATRYGILVDHRQSNASFWQLRGDAGMFEFTALWGNRIRNHGLSDLTFNTSSSTQGFKSLYLPLLERIRELQLLLNELTGEQFVRRYLMLDVRTSYTNPDADLKVLAAVLSALSITSPWP